MKKTLTTAIAAGGAFAIIVSALAIPASAFAQVGLGATVSASATVSGGGLGVGVGAGATLKAQLIGKAQTRADQEITRRITALNTLDARVGQMQKLSSDEKNSLAAAVQSQITLMNNLQAQITADVQAQSTSSLKTDIASITSSYRIFMLVIPQGAIEAASDRVMTITSSMTALSGQLQARVTAANASGTDVTAAETSLTDMNAKIADANAQATAANTEVASLTPDNGNATVMASNTAALKDARSKIQASQQDFITARQDVLAIVKDLKISVDASVSASATTQ